MASDVKLSVDLEAGDVTSAASELQQRLRAIFEDSAGKEISTSLQTLQTNLVATSQKAQETAKAIETMENTPSSKMAELLEQEKIILANLDIANDKLDKAQSDAQKFVKDRGGVTPDSLVHTEIWDETLTKLHELKNLQAEVAEGSANFLRTVATAPNGLGENITELIEEYRQIQETIPKLIKESQPFLEKALSAQDIGERTDAQNKYDEYAKRIDELKQNLGVISNLIDETLSEIGAVPDMTAERFLGANTEIAELEDRIKEVRGDLRQLRKEGNEFTPISSLKAFRGLASSIEYAKTEVDNLTASEQENANAQLELADTGKDTLAGELPDAYKKLIDKQQNYNNKIAIGIRRIEELGDSGKELSIGDKLKQSFGGSIVDFANNINQLPQMIENAMDEVVKTLPPHVQAIYSVIKLGVKQIVGAYKEAFSEVSTIIKNGLTKAANVATTAVKALVKEVAKLASSAFLSPIKKLGDSISNIGKQANTSAPSLKQLGRMFLQYGLGARSLYRLINKLRTALFAGFADLALVDEPFNAAMSSIVSSLEYLKNAFAAAFAPIIQAVAPALSAFINMVAEAVVWLGQLIALLTGQPFKIAVPTFKDYASSTSAGAAAAKNAAKAEKERAKALKKTAKEMRTIAGFDDVEILKAPEDKDSSSSSPSSGGGGGGGGGLAFQTAPISEGLQKFADMLKKIWETADAYDLGVLFGQKLGDLLRAFNKAVPDIEAVTTKIAKIIASFLAGFLSVNETFAELGKAIGNVVNIVFTTLDAFLDTFISYDGFKNLGKDIYLTILNALNTIEWETIYKVFGKVGVGIAQTLNEALTKPDLWEAVFRTLTGAISALLARAYGFVHTLKWGDIGTAFADGVIEGIRTFPYVLLATTAAEFVNGIFNAIGSFADEMEGHWEEIGKNIANTIRLFFAKTDSKENGKSLGKFLQGLFDALKSFAETIKFEEIAQNIIDFIDGFFEKFDWKENADTLLGLLNDLLDYFLKTVNTIGWENIIGQIWDYIKNSPEVEKFLENIWNTITLIAAAKLQLKLMKFYLLGKMIIGGILNGIINALLSIGTWIETHIFKPIYDGIVKAFDIGSPSKEMEPLGGFIIEGVLQGILNGLLNIAAWINEHIFTPIKDGIHNAFGIAGDTAEKILDVGSSIVQAIWNGAKDTLGAPLSWLQEHIATPIKSGLETAFGIAGGVASKIKEIGSAVVNGFKSGAEAETPKVNTSATEINEKMQTSLSAGDWDKIGSGVINKVKSGMDSVKSAITSTAQTIQKVVYVALENADWSKIGSTAINKVKSGMDSIKNAITSTAKSIQSAIYKALETADWSKIGSNAITKMKSGMDSIKSAITSVAKSIQGVVYKTLETGDWSKIGSNAVTKVKDGMSRIRSTIIDTAKSIQNGVYEALNNGEWYDIGDNIIEGIWKGLKDGWDWLETKVWNLAVDLFNAACRALNINSPSKLFADKVGAMIPAGIGIGITDNEKSATDSVETMAQSLVNSAKNIKLPPIAMGEIIPSGIANRNNNDQTTLSSLLNVLQSLQSEMVTKDELEELLTDMFREHMNIDFHIGDEKLARHVNRGNSLLDRRYNPIRN